MRNYFIIMFCCTSSLLFSQVENKKIEEGNTYYEQGKFTDAEAGYKLALEKNPNSLPATFNLGNALFGQEKFDDAMQYFQKIGESTSDPSIRAEAYHNLGNANLMKQEYEKSIDAYKKALKANPNDQDTKYNLAYAQQKLKQQQQQQKQQQDKDQQQKQDDQKKDDKNKKDQQQNKDQQQQNQNKEQQQKPQQKKYSKEDLERIMQALNNEDKKTQDKVNKQKMETQKVSIDKDW